MKAVALISGGLDSILAACLVSNLGIDILPVNFKIPFCHNIKEEKLALTAQNLTKENLKKDLLIIDISKDFLELLENPCHGFGSNMNPCIDCKILMLKEAKKLMEEKEARFVITGEVLGQRPMSQHRQALLSMPKKSGLEGLVLRPLSAKLLPETIPEANGWVKREKLLSFGGRGRNGQLRLAASFGIKDFSWPAGGCLLTDPGFSRKLRDLIVHSELNMDNVMLLKTGRHFRLGDKIKLVVGRNEKENAELERFAKQGDYLFYPNELTAGPTSLGRGGFSKELLELSGRITCRYCDLNGAQAAEIIYKKHGPGGSVSMRVSPIEEAQLDALRLA